jgi:60 kDa SS-A/Ro ribonucleoprotein
MTDEQALHRARVHPISVLLASAVYNSGKGLRGKQAWKVNHRVSEALDTAFYAAFANVEPTGKRYCVALDVSGLSFSILTIAKIRLSDF